MTTTRAISTDSLSVAIAALSTRIYWLEQRRDTLGDAYVTAQLTEAQNAMTEIWAIYHNVK